MAIAVEGVICLMMAAPLSLALSAFGGAIGYHLQARHWRTASPAMMCIALLAVPALFGAERAAGLLPPKYVVRSAIEIEQEFSHSFRLRDGRIVEWRMYDGQDQALAAVGLRE